MWWIHPHLHHYYHPSCLFGYLDCSGRCPLIFARSVVGICRRVVIRNAVESVQPELHRGHRGRWHHWGRKLNPNHPHCHQYHPHHNPTIHWGLLGMHLRNQRSHHRQSRPVNPSVSGIFYTFFGDDDQQFLCIVHLTRESNQYFTLCDSKRDASIVICNQTIQRDIIANQNR